METPQLQRGQALVLRGPQGCGKSTIARQIAHAIGSYRETRADRMAAPFEMGTLMSDDPQTLIVEGLPTTRAELDGIRAMLGAETILVDLKGREPRAVRVPNFIFCTGERDVPLSILADSRRFRVVNLP